MCGLTDPRMAKMSTAAMPARKPDRPKAAAMTRLALTPMSRTASKSSAAARMAVPMTVRRSSTSVPDESDDGDADDEDVLHADLQPAQRQAGVHPVGLGDGPGARGDERLEGVGDEDAQPQRGDHHGDRVGVAHGPEGQPLHDQGRQHVDAAMPATTQTIQGAPV